jgi:protein gp37
MNKTGIEWCDETWNPVVGCTPVSKGCAHCYAKGQAKRNRKRCAACGTFTPHFHPERLDQPLRQKKPSVIFVCSMGDLFHEDVRTEWWVKIFGVMAEATQHTFVVLTKRPAQMWSCLEDFTPLPNVWLGVSAENQSRLDERMPHLMRLASAGWNTVVNLEPLLGPVVLKQWLPADNPGPSPYESQDEFLRRLAEEDKRALSGVILGGETGPGTRSLHPDWVRKVRDQCKEAGVPFFFKQWGEWAEIDSGRIGDIILDGHGHSAALCKSQRDIQPGGFHGVLMHRVGRKRAGRVLDGRTHDELPWKTKEKP